MAAESAMTAWVAGIGVACASFGLQAWPRILRPLFGIDGWRHLLIARYLRTHRRLPGEGDVPNYLFTEGTDYPPLLRIFLAAWPPKSWLLMQRFLAPAFDACHVVTIFAAVWWVLGDWRLAVMAQAAYALNPLVVMENSHLHTRSLSALLFTWTVGPVIAWSLTGAWGWLLVGTVAMALLLLAHRLAVQALIVLVVLAGISGRSWTWSSAFAGGMALAALLSRGFYWTVLRGHLLMLAYWFQNRRNRYAHQIRGFVTPPGKPTDVVLVVQRWFSKVPAFAVFAGFPFAWAAVAFAVLRGVGTLSGSLGVPDSVVDHLVFWAIALLGWGVVVRQVPLLRFLGEGERYGEYAAFPVAILSALLLRWGLTTDAARWWGMGFALLAVGGGLVPTILLQRRVILRDDDRSVTTDHQQIYDVIRHEMTLGPVRLATLPLGLADAATYFTGCPALTTDSSLAHWRYYSEFSPVLRRPLAEILQRFRITHVLVSETFVSLAELHIPTASVIAKAGPLRLLQARGGRYEGSVAAA